MPGVSPVHVLAGPRPTLRFESNQSVRTAYRPWRTFWFPWTLALWGEALCDSLSALEYPCGLLNKLQSEELYQFSNQKVMCFVSPTKEA
jgi:hypothetical protein